MTVYVVEHFYDVDGGGDYAIRENDVIAIFETREEAEAFVAKYNNVQVYDRITFALSDDVELRYGDLYIIPIETGKYDESEFWWLDEEGDE